jgi:DNA-binding CsgD family transcriptional regulator
MQDAVDLVETVYSLAGDEQQWLDRIVDVFHPRLPRGIGLFAHTYEASDRLEARAITLRDVDPAMVADRPKVALRPEEQNYLVPIMRTGFVETLRNAPSALRRAGLPEGRVQEYERVLDQQLRAWNIVDQFWINAQDPTHFGCSFIISSRERGRWLPREAAAWRCISAHLMAAFRIRRQFGASCHGAPDPSTAEAVFSPNGRLEHAAAPAHGESARDALRRAVIALDQARGPLRRRDPEQALGLWQALVAGRWSLLDYFDSDNRRFVIAHRNDAGVPDARGLTHRERQVVAHAALGHANKVIAYELGLSVSTVAGHLGSARRKLSNLQRAVSPREE